MSKAKHTPATVATITQTVALLVMSRGDQPKVFPPATRIALLRLRWIARAGKRRYEPTDAGRQALAASPHLEQAQRAIDGERWTQPGTGYQSDSVMRSVRR